MTVSGTSTPIAYKYTNNCAHVDQAERCFEFLAATDDSAKGSPSAPAVPSANNLNKPLDADSQEMDADTSAMPPAPPPSSTTVLSYTSDVNVSGWG